MTEDELDGWPHGHHGHGFVWTLGVGESIFAVILHTSGFPNLSLILACGQTSSCVQFSSVAQSCLDSATSWSAARQASLSITNSQSLLKFMSIELVMPSNHLIFCCPLLLSPSIFPSISSSYHVSEVLEFQLQHQSFQ